MDSGQSILCGLTESHTYPAPALFLYRHGCGIQNEESPQLSCLTIKVCMSEDADDLPVQTEDKTFYSDDDFYDFLSHRGWTRLRKNNGYQNIDRMDELCPGAVYYGVI
ncbi:hypothetical protein H5410_022754 [Solanum commersonii]|uniref:GT-1/4-like C-terminal domain-containing protein n=1 Tax=Solanum commersonii TaxID=4109 RepID=A0A9J5ZEY2_SOLCO|nr:hypothetical protein H5410_022754 [Solanum commersonii]